MLISTTQVSLNLTFVLFKGMLYLGNLPCEQKKNHPLFVCNNKYFSLKLWEMVKNMIRDVNRLLFFLEIKKNYKVGKTEIKFFFLIKKSLLTSVYDL